MSSVRLPSARLATKTGRCHRGGVAQRTLPVQAAVRARRFLRWVRREALGARYGWPGLLACLFLVAGCDLLDDFASAVPAPSAAEECAADEICGARSAERVRAIKPYVVTSLASGAARRFSGEVTAANSAPLSFPVGGRVETIDTTAGDMVERGQILATLDSAPFQITVDAARADVSAAQTVERTLRTDLDRQRQLRQNGWISEAALDQAEAEYENARSQVSVARSRLTLAERDLANTRLRAPFDGVVAAVGIDPFTEVRPGQTILTVETGDSFEVVLSVPDQAIGALSLGAPASIDVAALPLCGCTGRVIEIGAVSSAGNAVDVTVAVMQSPGGLIAGMTAEVVITVMTGDEVPGYFIPLSAIAPSDDGQTATVFRYDREEGVVRRVVVRPVRNISSASVAVEGLEAGDIIAAAGVSFLADGQRVTLLGESEG